MHIPPMHQFDSRFGAAKAAAMDYGLLVATIQSMQLSTHAGLRTSTRSAAPAEAAPLPQILLARSGWQEAVLAQGGSFHPAVACGALAPSDLQAFSTSRL